jgi:uracil-DNA glycosylase family 4
LEVIDSKLKQYSDIHREWIHCTKCPLGERACQHVIAEIVGVGPGLSSPRGINDIVHVMFIGEGPGRGEDAVGRPFIGPAGKLLRHVVQEAGLYKYNLCYTNLLACRPCDTQAGPNRPPQEIEVEACRPRLVQLIRALTPIVVMPLGNIPIHYLHSMIVGGGAIQHQCHYHEAQHPAAVLRQGGTMATIYQSYLDKFIAVRLRLEELYVRP